MRLGYLPVQGSQWHNWLRSHQAQNKWDLAVCWFRGRNDITDWDATKLKIGWGSRFLREKWENCCHSFNVTAEYICGPTILWMRIGKWLWRPRSHEEKWGDCCHRFNVNVIAEYICGPTILWMRIGKWLWRGNQMGTGPLGFLANPQLSTGLICLYQLPFWVGLAMLFPSAW